MRGVPFRNTSRTVIRAGFGMYNDLQDALGYRTDQNAPFNPTYSLPNLAVSKLPLSTTVPSTAKLVPGGVQPNLQTPTLISWSFRVEQEITPNTVLRVGYVGSHGYHEIIGIDANEPFPVICPASPCPSVYPATFPAGIAGTPVPAGTYYVPTATRANPAIANTWTYFSEGDSSYNALQIDVNHRFSGGLSLRGVYTWSKTLDDGDSLNATTSGDEPALASNPFDLRADKGLANFDVRNAAAVNGVYELPFGHGKTFAANATGFGDTMISGLEHQLHPHAAKRLSVYAAAQLQPVEQRRHAQSGAAVRESGVHRSSDYWLAEPVVQSRRVPGAAERQRILRESGPGYADRARSGNLGCFGFERHAHSRAVESAISRGVLQHPEPRQFQHAQRGSVYSLRHLADGGRDHQHVHYIAPDSVRAEAAFLNRWRVSRRDLFD